MKKYVKTTKILAVLLALFMLCASMTACNDENDEKNSSVEESKASMVESSEDTSETSEAISEETSEESSSEIPESSESSEISESSETSEVSESSEISETSESSEATSSEASSEASEDLSSETSEEASEEVPSEAPSSPDFDVPEGYKGHLAGDYMEKVVNLEKGFGLVMSYDVTEEGVSVSMSIDYHIKGENFLMKMDMSIMGIESSESILYKDGVFYQIIHEDKTYEKLSSEALEEMMLGDIFAIDGSESTEEFLRSYEKKEKGVTYVVEEYKSISTVDGETTESIELIYFKDGKIVFIEFEGQRMAVEFIEGAEDSLFEIPSDYKEKEPFKASDILKVPEEYKDLAVAKALEKYVDAKTFGFQVSFEVKQEDGVIAKNEGVFAVKEEMAYIYEKTVYVEPGSTNFDKYEMKSIFKDGVVYDVDFDAKSYTWYDSTLEMFLSSSSLFDRYEYSKTTTKEIDGVKYTVDHFVYELYGEDEEEYFTQKFYTKDGKLEYIELAGDMMKIDFIEEDKITDDLFEIPDGFTEESEDDIFGDL